MYMVATLAVFTVLSSSPALAEYEVLAAINVGGEAHIDSLGIYYSKDNNIQGQLLYCTQHSSIKGLLSPKDEYIYKSYRQGFQNYDLETAYDGDYLLILQFVQCGQSYSNQRALTVKLNARHTVIQNLDITKKVGIGAALDIHIPFRICNGRIHINYEISQVHGNNLRVEFTDERGASTLCSGLVMLKGDFDTIPDSIWPTKEQFDLTKTECVVAVNQQVGEHRRTAQYRGSLYNNRPIVMNFYNSSLNFGFMVDQGLNISAFEVMGNLNASVPQSSNQE